jgi:phage baseplate assembly protein W
MGYTYKDIDISFEKHPISNDILTKVDSGAVKQALRLLVETPIYSRGFNNIGISIEDMLFEQYHPSMDITVKKDLTYLIEQEEPRVDLDRIEIDSSNIDNGEISIYIYFNILNNPIIESLRLPLKRLR